MAFYIKPPRGKLRLEDLQRSCTQRLRFLHDVQECDCDEQFQELCQNVVTVSNSECLIEGSKQDAITHFTLRLICSGDAELTSFFVHAETKLFKHRFNLMNVQELCDLFHSVDRYLKSEPSDVTAASCDNSDEDNGRLRNILGLLGCVEQGRTWPDVVEMFKTGNSAVTFTVPFQYALKSVARRDVEVTRGRAVMPYTKLGEVVTFIFRDLLSVGMATAQRMLPKVLVTDQRIAELCQDVKKLHRTFEQVGKRRQGRDISLKVQQSRENIHCNNIDSQVFKFPPCMSHLHHKLRQCHRLRHHSRIQYTLFLKEIGLSVSDALQFWKTEYSKTHCGHGEGCTHNWAKDGKRYTYNIRHLYGLEGSCTEYRAHSCRSIQERVLGPGEEGGCPFKHFDSNHLQSKLQTGGIPQDVQEDVVSRSAEKDYMTACQSYLKVKVTQRMGKKVNAMEQEVSDEETTSEEKLKRDGNGQTNFNFSSANRESVGSCDSSGKLVYDSLNCKSLGNLKKSAGVMLSMETPSEDAAARNRLCLNSGGAISGKRQSSDVELDDVNCGSKVMKLNCSEQRDCEDTELVKSQMPPESHVKQSNIPKDDIEGGISSRSAATSNLTPASDIYSLNAERMQHYTVKISENQSETVKKAENENKMNDVRLEEKLSKLKIRHPADYYYHYCYFLQKSD
ncbi:uncharacterized protein [Ptychodera flava]|uniref:uncharacterized protein n=1 Tax=Ptychodera flava TaxID=63121 RepID=UPI00396A6FE1